MKHSFDTAFYKYACHLQDRLGQSASSRGWMCRESSGPEEDGRYILRTAPESKVATVFSDGSVELHK
jgi:hypothetical protein